MTINRRAFTITVASLAAVAGKASAKQSTQADVTTGALGLSLAEAQASLEEGPVGQSFRSFILPDFDAAIFIDFGQDDIARSIWVDGSLTEDDATALLYWLVPDDLEDEHHFQMLASAGSIELTKSVVASSPALGEILGNRGIILAQYSSDPADQLVKNLKITTEI